jgi:VWFA-related protein
MNRGIWIVMSLLVGGGVVSGTGQQQQDPQAFRFRTGVELINVTATVTDNSGRFVSGLRKEDFRIFEDGQEQQITHFNSERVPVSLGIVLDTSGSMEGEKMVAARQALNRFLFQLLDRDDEVFLYRFDNMPQLVEGWSTDRERMATELARIRPRGATALFDAVAEAVPLAQTGKHRKKAVVVISDGNDTTSRTSVRELKQLIRESEVLVYAIGIDSQATTMTGNSRTPGPWSGPPQGPRMPIPLPFPIPGGRRPPPGSPPRVPPSPTPPTGGMSSGRPDDRVNVAALRDITDDSGGRTEIIRSARDLDPATTGIADELSKQYYLGYPAQQRKDGQWHAIRVDVRNGNYLVRARKGYIATP